MSTPQAPVSCPRWHAYRRLWRLLALTLADAQATEAQITEDGVIPESRVVHTLDLTDVAVEHISEKFSIPLPYLKRCLADAEELADENVNHWLVHDPQKLYIRAYTPEDVEAPGVCRAVLSSRYRTIDNIDILTAAAAGISEAGLSMSDLQVSADVTDRRMRLRINCPGVHVEAMDLLERYYDPRSGRSGRDQPIISAGIDMRNSDVGGGAFQLAPYFTVLVCTNGMTRTRDAMRHVHLGGKMDDGVIDWSKTTLTKALELVQAKTTDAVRTFLSPEYLAEAIAEIRAMKQTIIHDAVKTITDVTGKASTKTIPVGKLAEINERIIAWTVAA
jgi:hypothetical protein